MLKVTQSVNVLRHGMCRLTEKYVLVGGFKRYALAKEMLNAASTLDVLCDGNVVTIQFGQIILPPKKET